MFSDHNETSLSIAAVSTPSVARSILAVLKTLSRDYRGVHWNANSHVNGSSFQATNGNWNNGMAIGMGHDVLYVRNI